MSDAFGVAGAGQDLCSLLRSTVKSLLLNTTLAGPHVETSRADAIDSTEPCVIAIYTTKISRDWLGTAPVAFIAKVSLVIMGRVLSTTQADAETQVDQLRVQVENILFPALFPAVQALERVNSVETTINFPAEGQFREAIMAMTLECQCYEEFYLNPTTKLTTIGLTVPNLTEPAGSLPAENLIGAIITIPQS